MAIREDMKLWVREAVARRGGTASIIEVAKEIWDAHESDLKSSGDSFYTWQYDMRWAAQKLRDENKLKLRKVGSRSQWLLP